MRVEPRAEPAGAIWAARLPGAWSDERSVARLAWRDALNKGGHDWTMTLPGPSQPEPEKTWGNEKDDRVSHRAGSSAASAAPGARWAKSVQKKKVLAWPIRRRAHRRLRWPPSVCRWREEWGRDLGLGGSTAAINLRRRALGEQDRAGPDSPKSNELAGAARRGRRPTLRRPQARPAATRRVPATRTASRSPEPASPARSKGLGEPSASRASEVDHDVVPPDRAGDQRHGAA